MCACLDHSHLRDLLSDDARCMKLIKENEGIYVDFTRQCVTPKTVEVRQHICTGWERWKELTMLSIKSSRRKTRTFLVQACHSSTKKGARHLLIQLEAAEHSEFVSCGLRSLYEPWLLLTHSGNRLRLQRPCCVAHLCLVCQMER